MLRNGHTSVPGKGRCYFSSNLFSMGISLIVHHMNPGKRLISGLPLHPPVSLGFLVPLCRKHFGLSIFACFRVPRNLWNVTAKVKGQGHCKIGRFHEISIFWDIFGNIIAAFFKSGMLLDPIVTHFPRSYN